MFHSLPPKILNTEHTKQQVILIEFKNSKNPLEKVHMIQIVNSLKNTELVIQ